ncbi:MAG: hypothetical protein U9Q71_02530, partial [Pseudomonadota bacterium]|nr:hypothetical protein [Pseudomonadota bacterium]
MDAQSSKLVYIFCLSAGFYASALLAQPPAGVQKDAPATLRETIWGAPVLYENTDGHGVRSFALIGRYHGQYWSVDADQGKAKGWENRRVIFGFNSQFSEHFSLEAQIHINDEFSDPLYDELYVGFIEWASTKRELAVSLGRLDYVFTGL